MVGNGPEVPLRAVCFWFTICWRGALSNPKSEYVCVLGVRCLRLQLLSPWPHTAQPKSFLVASSGIGTCLPEKSCPSAELSSCISVISWTLVQYVCLHFLASFPVPSIRYILNLVLTYYLALKKGNFELSSHLLLEAVIFSPSPSSRNMLKNIFL